MHIVHYIPRIRSEEGGVVRAAVDLVSTLVGQGCRVTVLTHDSSDAPRSWEEPPRPEIVRLAAGHGPRSLLRRRDRATARRAMEEADVLHLHGPWALANPQLAREARSLGVPYILSAHGMLADWSMAQSRLKKRLYLATVGRWLMASATFVHFTATEELEQGRKWLFGAPGRVVPLLLDLEPFRSLPGPRLARTAFDAAPPDSHRLLFLSRLHRKKGIERLLEAIARLRDQGVECDLVIAGTGEKPYVDTLRDQVSELDLGERVHFVGHVVGELKVSLYESSDVFVLPTSQENFGLVLPESLACRTPVITTRGVDIWRELEQSGGALIVSARGRELAGAIRELLEDPARRREMGDRGRRWVFERMAPDAVVGGYLDLYQRARDGESPRGDVLRPEDLLLLEHQGMPLLAFPEGQPEMTLHALGCLAAFSRARRLHRRAILLFGRLFGPRFLLTRSRGARLFDRDFSLAAFVADVLPAGEGEEIFPVVSFPSDLERRRFYVSLLSQDGERRFFVKARMADRADSPWRGELEARAALAGVRGLPFALPRIHRSGYSHGAHFLLMDALPPSARRPGASSSAATRWLLEALARCSRHEGRIDRLPWWQTFLASSEKAPDLRDELVEQGERIVTVSTAHGDFQRPNLYFDGETRWLVDWEDFTEFGPILLDELRFFLGDRTRALAKSPRPLLERAASRFGADRDAERRLQLALALAYLCSRANDAGLLCGAEWPALGPGAFR